MEKKLIVAILDSENERETFETLDAAFKAAGYLSKGKDIILTLDQIIEWELTIDIFMTLPTRWKIEEDNGCTVGIRTDYNLGIDLSLDYDNDMTGFDDLLEMVVSACFGESAVYDWYFYLANLHIQITDYIPYQEEWTVTGIFDGASDHDQPFYADDPEKDSQEDYDKLVSEYIKALKENILSLDDAGIIDLFNSTSIRRTVTNTIYDDRVSDQIETTEFNISVIDEWQPADEEDFSAILSKIYD